VRLRDNVFFWSGCGSLLTVAFALWAGASVGWELAWAVGGGLLAMGIWVLYTDASPLTGLAYTELPASAVHAVVRDVFDRPGWTTRRDDEMALSFERRLPLSLGLAIFFALLGLIPAVIYIVLGSNRRQFASIRMFENAEGTGVEFFIRPKGSNGRRIARRLFDRLRLLERGDEDLSGKPSRREHLPAV
jgi:hypothetical protein